MREGGVDAGDSTTRDKSKPTNIPTQYAVKRTGRGSRWDPAERWLGLPE